MLILLKGSPPKIQKHTFSHLTYVVSKKKNVAVETCQRMNINVKHVLLCHRAAGPASSQPEKAWVGHLRATRPPRAPRTSGCHRRERFPRTHRIPRAARSEGSGWANGSQGTQRWESHQQLHEQMNVWLSGCNWSILTPFLCHCLYKTQSLCSFWEFY